MKAFKIIKDICNKPFLETNKKEIILSYLQRKRFVQIDILASYLSQGIWPYNQYNCFEKDIFKLFSIRPGVLKKRYF